MNTKARYVICTIATKDQNVFERAKKLRDKGETYESIFMAGLEILELPTGNI